jgi:hypothetical protein
MKLRTIAQTVIQTGDLPVGRQGLVPAGTGKPAGSKPKPSS